MDDFSDGERRVSVVSDDNTRESKDGALWRFSN
jgi:hypothetical protein